MTPRVGADLPAALELLASPVRISLLRLLRTPKTLGEIKLRVTPSRGDTSRKRLLARQTVKEHLDKLVERGFVVTRTVERDRGETTEYVIDNRTIYALAEDLRELARLRPTAELGLVTMDRSTDDPAALSSGPALVIVKGLDEGRAFPLSSPGGQPRTWSIGRGKDRDVTLDFDPFVSSTHARVHFDGDAYFVEDLPESRNGTYLNFAPLQEGVETPLGAGDVIGVGRTHLVLRS